MRTLAELEKAVNTGLTLVKREQSIRDALVYASANDREVGRLCYTSHIPCNGVQELKAEGDYGVSVHVHFKDGTVGFGQEVNDLSAQGLAACLEKARKSAIVDPDFHGFPSLDEIPIGPRLPAYHDGSVMDMTPRQRARLLATLSWETLKGAFEVFRAYLKQQGVSAEDAGFIVSGDQFLIRERMAMATMFGIREHDESTIALSFLTAMVEGEESKGSSWGALPVIAQLRPLDIGREAAANAVAGVGHKLVPSGKHRVVFGPQAVVDLFHLLSASLDLSMVEAGGGIFVRPQHFPGMASAVPASRYGERVASELLTVYDDATMPGGAGTKRVTCEGYPTGRMELIRDGILCGFLAEDYMRRKVLNRAESLRTVGMTLGDAAALLVPRNGFRFGRGGGRIAAASAQAHATNVVIESKEQLSAKDLLARVGEGLYIGRLWYTYPVGGYSTGEISGTAIADSYHIRNGKLAEPITPNSLRLNDNLKRMLEAIIGIGAERRATICWASDEIVYAPWIAIDGVNLTAIGSFK